jgi:hypothetical protein
MSDKKNSVVKDKALFADFGKDYTRATKLAELF